MWISRKEYERWVEAAARHDATIEWMRVRLNQVEAERAALFAQVTGIGVMVPTITRPSVSPDEVKGPVEPIPDGVLAGLSALFEDVGDDMAKKMGAGHDEAGVLQFR